MKRIWLWSLVFISVIAIGTWLLINSTNNSSSPKKISAIDSSSQKNNSDYWIAPDSTSIPSGTEGELIWYGRKLIANTSNYLGPNGTVAHISNGMNCQNCHLAAGTKPYGNNYGAVFSTYPKFRDRSGTVESIFKRVNDCIERSLNGKPLDSMSHQMQAIIAYISWLGKDVKKGVKPKGAGITELDFLNRAAEPEKGKMVFAGMCARCHGVNGEGQKLTATNSYLYPPLWGDNSYNTGAGLFRLARFAGYVKDNMPYGARHDSTILTDEQAWDVAAFVNSQFRPEKNLRGDWPDISTKPIDYPFGPYADEFSEVQHKYGPFIEIKKYRDDEKKKTKIKKKLVPANPY